MRPLYNNTIKSLVDIVLNPFKDGKRKDKGSRWLTANEAKADSN
jgi:hypothetical protein